MRLLRARLHELGKIYDLRISCFTKLSHLSREIAICDLRQLHETGLRCLLSLAAIREDLRFAICEAFVKQATEAEEAYNFHFIRARGCVERTFGVLKARFSVLGPDSRIRLKCETTTVMVVACAVLHNICVRKKVSLEDEIPLNLEDFNQTLSFAATGNSTVRGSAFRASLIRRFFNQ